MFRRLFLVSLAILVAALAVFAALSGEALRSRLRDEISRRLESEAEVLAVLVRSNPPAPALQASLRESGHRAGTRFTVIGADGRVSADSQADPTAMDEQNARPEVTQARSRGRGRDVRSVDGVRGEFLFHAQPADPARPQGTVVRTALSLASVDEALGDFYGKAAVAFLLLGLGGVAILYLMARRTTRPLREIRSVAQAIAAGDFAKKAPLPSTDEVGSVAAAINRMADELSVRLERVRTEGAKLEAALSSLQDGVIAVDREGKVVHHNAAARTLLDLLHDPAGLKVWEAVRVPGLEDRFRAALKDGTPGDLSVESGPRSLALKVLPTSGGGGAVLVARDVSEERRYDRLRKDFVANVSHELRTPLTLIKGYVETLRDGAMEDRERAPEFLETIDKNVRRLSALVDDLLQLSRLESGGQVVNPRAVEARPLLEGVLGDFRTLAEKRRQSLSLEVAPDLAEFHADPDLVDRAVSNLVDNAIKYTPEGGSVKVRAGADDDSVVITVEDSGTGIPEADLPRVFERFYRVDKSRSRELGGTGLGLAIVKHIAQLHGGTVTVRSRLGQGSAFTLRLPR